MVAPLDLLAWLRKGKLLQCFFSVGPKEWSSGPQLFEIFFSLPCMSQKCHGLNRNLIFCRLSFSGVQSVEHMMWHWELSNHVSTEKLFKSSYECQFFGEHWNQSEFPPINRVSGRCIHFNSDKDLDHLLLRCLVARLHLSCATRLVKPSLKRFRQLVGSSAN